ncbi:type I-E CRISPR-associated protein Cse2/CasB [Streptomyces cyaneofuscatus]|uniref:type I-E CRISPR-associated protein Cse2/CasB n=1 Tax=Streptomyces cyaneofuscatus TaxID=66883 RepID=UPI0034380ECF
MARTPFLHATLPPPRPASREDAAAGLVKWLFHLINHGQLRTLSVLQVGAPAAPALLTWDLPAPGTVRPSGFPRLPFSWDNLSPHVPVKLGPGVRFTYPEWFTYRKSDDAPLPVRDGEAFRTVAQLFAIYYRNSHQRRPGQLLRGSPGSSLGTALRPFELRKIRHSVPPGDNGEPGTGGRLLNELVRRHELPPQGLRRTFVTLRERELRPPDWRQLALDLGDWGTQLPRKHGPGGSLGPRTVADRWARDFYCPEWKY